jgi:magnesium chelatase family protein
VLYEEFRGSKEKPESSAEVKARINRARAIQAERFKDDGIRINAEMEASHLEKYCALDQAGERLLQKAFDKLNLSARGTTRILKVARTIADIDGSENIESKHVAEAIQYRGLERKYNR